MCPLNKTKKQHIFFSKKNCVYTNKKVTHFFLEKNLCTVDKKKKKKKRATEQFLFSKKT